MIVNINGVEAEVIQVWTIGAEAYVLFADSRLERYEKSDVLLEGPESVCYAVPCEKEIHTLFDIPVFTYDEAYPLDDERVQFTSVKFFIPRLQQYDSQCVSLNDNWDIAVWTEDGEVVVEQTGWLNFAPEFKTMLWHLGRSEDEMP